MSELITEEQLSQTNIRSISKQYLNDEFEVLKDSIRNHYTKTIIPDTPSEIDKYRTDISNYISSGWDEESCAQVCINFLCFEVICYPYKYKDYECSEAELYTYNLLLSFQGSMYERSGIIEMIKNINFQPGEIDNIVNKTIEIYRFIGDMFRPRLELELELILDMYNKHIDSYLNKFYLYNNFIEFLPKDSYNLILAPKSLKQITINLEDYDVLSVYTYAYENGSVIHMRTNNSILTLNNELEVIKEVYDEKYESEDSFNQLNCCTTYGYSDHATSYMMYYYLDHEQGILKKMENTGLADYTRDENDSLFHINLADVNIKIKDVNIIDLLYHCVLFTINGSIYATKCLNGNLRRTDPVIDKIKIIKFE